MFSLAARCILYLLRWTSIACALAKPRGLLLTGAAPACGGVGGWEEGRRAPSQRGWSRIFYAYLPVTTCPCSPCAYPCLLKRLLLLQLLHILLKNLEQRDEDVAAVARASSTSMNMNFWLLGGYLPCHGVPRTGVNSSAPPRFESVAACGVLWLLPSPACAI